MRANVAEPITRKSNLKKKIVKIHTGSETHEMSYFSTVD